MVTREDQPLKVKDKPKQKTFRDKLKHIKDNITVEPVLACYVIPTVLSRLAIQNLNLDKACRVNLNYTNEVCDALVARKGDKYLNEELKVQELIAGIEIWKEVILTAIPSFLILFLGAWSDRTGRRKICILLPIVGDFLSCISNIVNVYFFYQIPVQVTCFFEAFFSAITGGWIVVYMGVFSYLNDISSEESRTFRVGIVNLCSTAGRPVGSALSGILLEAIGYYGVFTLTAFLYLFSILYGAYYLQDPEKIIMEKKSKEKSGLGQFLKTFFELKHVKESVRVTFMKGPNNRRLKLILVFLSVAVTYGPSHGEFTVRYLFTRYRFNWDALKYSFFSTFYICVHAFGALVSISLFSRYLKWDDSVLGLISMVSKIMGGIATAFARNSLEMYLAVIIETFNATPFTALRAISSKLVASAESGKMIALFNLMEVITSMIFGPLYSWIYLMTVQIDAGFIYYVSTVLTVISIAIFGWFFYNHRICSLQKSKTEPENNEDNTHNNKDAEHGNIPLISSLDIVDENIFLEN